MLSELFLIIRRVQRDIIINIHRSLSKVPVILVRIYKNLNSLERFSKNTQISNLMKVRPVGAELFHAEKQADRQTDRHDEADSHFSKFWERALTNKYKRTQ